MRVAVASAGTKRHVLSADLEGFPPGTKGLCDAPVDIEITRYTQQSIKAMKICPKCLDLWVAHLKSVRSLVGEKAQKHLDRMPKRTMTRLAIRPLEALRGVFGGRHKR